MRKVVDQLTLEQDKLQAQYIDQQMKQVEEEKDTRLKIKPAEDQLSSQIEKKNQEIQKKISQLDLDQKAYSD